MADGTSFFMALLIRNIIVTLLTFTALFLFFSLSAILNNIAFGYTFFYALLLLFFLFLALYSYVIFCSSFSNSAASAIAISIILYIIFFSLQIGVFQIMQKEVRYYSIAISKVVQWVSPFYYWYKGMEAVEYGNILEYLLNLLVLLLISFLLLFVSHFILKKKGVHG
jgi:ABC-type transport system involved in multi-copper enzyme maturation permease subunit